MSVQWIPEPAVAIIIIIIIYLFILIYNVVVHHHHQTFINIWVPLCGVKRGPPSGSLTLSTNESLEYRIE